MSEPLQLETSDTRYKDNISDQRDMIESIYNRVSELWRMVNTLYEERDKIDPDSKPEELDISALQNAFDELSTQLENSDAPITLDIIRLTSLDKELQDMLNKQFKELHKGNQDSFEAKRPNLDDMNRLDYSKKNFDKAQKSVGKVTDIKLTNNGKPLTLDNLSKEQFLNLLNKEKTKRAKLDFTNSKVLQPELNKVGNQLQTYRTVQQKWNKVLSFDIKELDRLMVNFNKKESVISDQK